MSEIAEALGDLSVARLLGALLILLATYPAAVAVGWLAGRVMRRFPAARASSTRTAVRSAQGVVILVFVAWALNVIGLGPGWTMIIALILVVVGALVAQPVLANLAASMRLPFDVGDQIATQGYEGTVVDITATRTVLMTVDQRRVRLPNIDVMSGPLVSFTAADRRRSSLEVGVEIHADLDAVAGLLIEATAAADGVLDEPAPYVVPTGYARDAVLLVVKFWHLPDLKSAEVTPGAVVAAVKRALQDADIAVRGPEVYIKRE